ncbi:MAG: HRDC domain-containing protein, partial [Sandaracinaceae bacterium]
STGLGALLSKVLGIEVDKGLQQADWGIRPIPEDRLGYLIGDVRHLLALADHFEERVREADIAEEVDEETRYAMARAEEPEIQKEPWTRIKKSRDLNKPQLALLKALCDVREEVASDKDVPPFRIAPNAALLEAARRGPKTARDLSRVRGLRKLPRSGLARALESAERDGPPPPPPPPPPADVRARQKARERALQAWRNTEAERREVNVQVVLPGHCLRDIASLEDGDDVRSVAGFGDKRGHLYATALEAALSGVE